MTTAQVIGWLGAIGLSGSVGFMWGAFWAQRDGEY